MGRHAAPSATSSVARRATAVSAGTLVLCLGGFAPAFAATDPPPIPQPVSDVVQQISDATGLPNPIPPSEGATRQHHAPSHHAPATSGTSIRHASAGRSAGHAALVPVAVPSVLRAVRPLGLRATVPAIAETTRIQPSSALQPLPALSPRDDAPRILLVAIATLILGALAGSHIKAAQEFVFTS